MSTFLPSVTVSVAAPSNTPRTALGKAKKAGKEHVVTHFEAWQMSADSSIMKIHIFMYTYMYYEYSQDL